MRFNQLKQYGTTIHEDTLTTSTPIAKMIPSPIDADYARLFLATPLLYEALKASLEFFIAYDTHNKVISGLSLQLNEALAKAEEQ